MGRNGGRQLQAALNCLFSALSTLASSPDSAADMLPIVTDTFIQCRNVL